MKGSSSQLKIHSKDTMITNDNILNKEPIPPLLKVREVAKILSLSRATIKALIDSGDLSASPISPKRKKKMLRKHVRITRESLLDFYKGRFGHPLNRALQNPFQN
jgi:hypothetical protein